MKSFKQNNTKKAQQLVEFLFVAPFIIIILGIVTEYAYALSLNYTLYQGLKSVTSSLYSRIKPNMSSGQITTLAKQNLIDYLAQNNAPQALSNTNLNYMVAGDNAIFFASYKYKSAFTLPNVYFHILPSYFNFSCSVVVPGAFLKPNNYDDISSVQLDAIWSGVASFSSLDAFNASKKGIMKDEVGSGSMIFLVPAETALGDTQETYELVYWGGPSNTLYANFTDNKLYECKDEEVEQPDGTKLTEEVCKVKQPNYMTYLKNNYTNIIVYTDFIPDDKTEIATYWRQGANLCDLSTQGILKMALALYDSSNSNAGNYDNIAVSGYNSSVSASNKYWMYSSGSSLLIAPKSGKGSGAISAFGGS